MGLLMKAKAERRRVIAEEYCPYCDDYTMFCLDDVNRQGFLTCSHCGKRIHACYICAVAMGTANCGGCGSLDKRTENKWELGI